MEKVLRPILFLVFVLASCAKMDSVELSEKKSLEASDLLNVSYGNHQRHKLDVYLPQGRTNSTKVLIFVHGGSWMEGDKSSFTQLAKYFRDKGFACATINYRLTNTAENNVHPAQVNDLGAAINFISTKAAEWSVAPDSFGVLGASAGGHIGLLYTYNYNQNNKVKTVVSMASPADLTDDSNANPQMIQVVEWLLGTSLQANPGLYQQASPLTHVNAVSKPTLIFHGKKDVVVTPQQSVDLKAKLDQFGVKSKLILYENTGHEVLSEANTPLFLAEVETWFRGNL